MSALPKVLVVDDQPVNVQLLKRALEKEKIGVITALNGHDALTLVDREHPDVILLDVMMPEMDGIEVCQRLQADPVSKTIPVIFITARSSKEGKLAGLGVGAVDYITKPIDLDETVARVQTHLRFVQINREMLDLQRRLQESRRTASVGAITQGIAHNLNNLLSVVLGYLELIRLNADTPDAVRENADHLDTAVQRIVVIIRQLTSLVVKSRVPTTPRPLDELIANSVRRLQNDLRKSQPAVISVINPLVQQTISTHVEVFEDSLVKLLLNAYESYGENLDGPREIVLRTSIQPAVQQDTGPLLQILIEDKGRGINPEIRDHVFEPFTSSKNTVGVGMGLTVARHSLRNMGGDVELMDNPSGGTIAVFTHPVDRPVRRGVFQESSKSTPPFA
ncbi:histidine kinase [Verrucomicrobia bacterium IMCC26134]|jgi:DNA-binding response OmpR family regulator|nr:histidine kinase [Verrucomicrobia bacterium IMCC26134]